MSRWNTWRYSVGAKALAIILVVLLGAGGAVALGGSAAAILCAGWKNTREAAQEWIAEELLWGYAPRVGDQYLGELDPAVEFAGVGFTFTITDEDGKILQSNHTDGNSLAEVTYDMRYVKGNGYYGADGGYYAVDGYEEPEEGWLTVRLYADPQPTGDSWLAVAVRLIGRLFDMRWSLLTVGLLSWLLAVAVLVFLYCAAGRHPGEDVPRCNLIDRIPFDLYTAIIAAVYLIGALFLNELSWHIPMWFALVCAAALLAVGALLLLAYTMSLATRIKTHTLWRNTVIGGLCRFLWRGLRAIGSHISLLWRTVLSILVVCFAELFFMASGEMDVYSLFWIVEKAVLIPLVFLFVLGLRRLQAGAHCIANGQVDHQIKTEYLSRELRRTALDLNHIGDGLSGAVEARLKSERFKAELITNVSHDIKTPLTSIINYVDLLQKEQPESETMQAHLEVLQRQSARLKKLIEDLIEASKASTGNLTVNLEPCQLGVLLEQMVGEYSEKAAAAQLELRLEQPEEPLTVMADGRHMWRILDNLLNNVCKYAQPGTRVYLDLTATGRYACITFRNISQVPLHITGEELTERFVRGDSSRNTEGSGLGLSIARSLTELQHGQMALSVDGDLFKVILQFPIVYMPQEVS